MDPDPDEAVIGGYMMAIIKQTAALLAMALIFAGCTIGSIDEGGTKGSAITLAENTWVNGNIITGAEQWFRFTATAGTPYLHIGFGTLTHLYVQVYDSGNNPVGDITEFGGSSSYISLTVTSGKTYYLKVTPDSSGGSYRIAFNAMPSPPLPAGVLTAAKMLTENIWTSGALTSSNNEQWFKFTATAGTHYLHVFFATLPGSPGLSVQFYDRNGEALGGSTLTSSDTSTSLAISSGQECYVRVSGQNSGTYRIAFNRYNTPSAAN
jgi:hypothetical protein